MKLLFQYRNIMKSQLRVTHQMFTHQKGGRPCSEPSAAAHTSRAHRTDVISQRRPGMRYNLKPIQCRPWTLSYLSVELIESHYENNYGAALRRLNAITEQLESLDFANTPTHVLN